MCLRRCRRRISAGWLPFRLGRWGMGRWPISLKCSVARRRRSVGGSPNWINFRTIRRRAAFVVRVRVETKVTPGSEFELNLPSLMKTRTAGDPDDEDLVFTDLTPTRLEQEMEALQTPVSDDVIREWMDDQGFRLHQIRQDLAGGASPDRDAQFRNIATLMEPSEAADPPVFPWRPRRKSSSVGCFARGASVARGRLKPSITISPVGPTESSSLTGSISTVTFHVMRMIAKCKLVIANCKLNGVSISRLAGQDVLRTDPWQSVASGRVAASLPICNDQFAMGFYSEPSQ